MARPLRVTSKGGSAEDDAGLRSPGRHRRRARLEAGANVGGKGPANGPPPPKLRAARTPGSRDTVKTGRRIAPAGGRAPANGRKASSSGKKAAAAPPSRSLRRVSAREVKAAQAGKARAERARARKVTAGKAPAEKAKAGKTPAGRTTTGKAGAGKPRSGKAPAEKAKAGKTPAGRTTTGKAGAGKPRAGKTPAERAAAGGTRPRKPGGVKGRTPAGRTGRPGGPGAGRRPGVPGRRGRAIRKGRKIPVGTMSPGFRIFTIVMVSLIIIFSCLLVASLTGVIEFTDEPDAVEELADIVLSDGDHNLSAGAVKNVTHVFALRIESGELDLDEYTVRASKWRLDTWYDANTTAGTVIRAGASGGGDTAQFTLQRDSHKDPYHPSENRIEVQILKPDPDSENDVVVWFSRWDQPGGVTVE